MPTLIAFAAPDVNADYAFSVADVLTGNSFSPKAGAFQPGPPDELVRMARDLSPNRPGIRYGFLAVELVPPVPGQYLVYAHPAAGGPPVGSPFPVVTTATAARSPNFAAAY